MSASETIAAIITAPGEAGVSIVRVSGPEAFEIADKIFKCNAPAPSLRKANTFVYGKITDGDVEVDEGLLLIFRAPHSYTAEDVVEFQCHGGGTSAKRVLRSCFHAGARAADAGEFTRRAFLNGRIDLLQAEAIMDLVRAHSDRSQTAALQQLEGKLSQSFQDLYDRLLQVAAQLEATLDFPEDELPASVLPQILSNLSKAEQDLDFLLSTWNEGHVLRDGALVVLSGKPNVGKSTLLNTLLGHERAIVSDIAGTTRDSIEAEFILEGIPLRLVDTAGLRESVDVIEQQGIIRTRDYLSKADLHIHLIDLSQKADSQTYENFEDLIPGKSILVCNKSDLPRMFHVEQWPTGIPIVETAIKDEIGYQELKNALASLLSSSIDLSARPHAVISERHRLVLVEVKTELAGIKDLLSGCMGDEALVLAIPGLREALVRLGEVTGREYHEDLLDEVFSTFCIGK
ncbi:tRNA uridine-5-carboxymethylaminomethyl(34) synthesis GTPase MnmE [Kiritimatiellaeota bacterium B1221]|nr:tRNA uridine-5-carboxymethylaminomethyl(34) synthesis GTPase MnmE [Kiritimatiellaeota bacterium B1221]